MRICWGALLLLAACGPAAAPAAPAKPAAIVAKDGDLLTVTLTPEAEQRLGIRIVETELRKTASIRFLSGEAGVPPGRDVTVSAALAGTLGGAPPGAGTRVTKDQTIFLLTPLLAAESRASMAAAQADAEGAQKIAALQLEAGKSALARAERLLKDQAGSQRSKEEAKAQLDIAEAALRAAEVRREIWRSSLGAIPMAAPFNGVLRRLHVAPGQQVAGGAPLFEVVDLDRLWIRVAVHVGDLAGIDGSKDLLIEGLTARPVPAPPTADPLASTIDLVYEVENRAGILRPGQKVGVPLPLRSEEETITLPWSAVITDIHGGTWVYESLADRKYTRLRIRVSHVAEGRALLSGGPKAGTKIVAEGAAELYGTEFGHAK